MKLPKNKINKIVRKISRESELETGRVSFNRVFKSKKVYSRKKFKLEEN